MAGLNKFLFIVYVTVLQFSNSDSDTVKISLSDLANSKCGTDNWLLIDDDFTLNINRDSNSKVLKALGFSCATFPVNFTSSGSLDISVYLKSVSVDSEVIIRVNDGENETPLINYVYTNYNNDFEEGWHKISLPIDKGFTGKVTLLGFSDGFDIVLIDSIEYKRNLNDYTNDPGQTEIINLLPYKNSEFQLNYTYDIENSVESDLLNLENISVNENNINDDIYFLDNSNTRINRNLAQVDNLAEIDIEEESYDNTSEINENQITQDDNNTQGEESDNETITKQGNEEENKDGTTADGNNNNINKENNSDMNTEEDTMVGRNGEEKNEEVNVEDSEASNVEDNQRDNLEDNEEDNTDAENLGESNIEEENEEDQNVGDNDAEEGNADENVEDGNVDAESGEDGNTEENEQDENGNEENENINEEDENGNEEGENGNEENENIDEEDENGDEEDENDNEEDENGNEEDETGDEEDENGNEDNENGNEDNENGNEENENGNEEDEDGNEEDENGNEEDEDGNEEDEDGNEENETSDEQDENNNEENENVTDGAEEETNVEEPTPAPITNNERPFWNIWTITLVSVGSVTIVGFVAVGSYYLGKIKGKEIVAPLDLTDLEAPRIIPRVKNVRTGYERFGGSDYGSSSPDREF